MTPVKLNDASLKQCAKSIRVRSSSTLVLVLVQRGREYFVSFDGGNASHAAELLSQMAEILDAEALEAVTT